MHKSPATNKALTLDRSTLSTNKNQITPNSTWLHDLFVYAWRQLYAGDMY